MIKPSQQQSITQTREQWRGRIPRSPTTKQTGNSNHPLGFVGFFEDFYNRRFTKGQKLHN